MTKSIFSSFLLLFISFLFFSTCHAQYTNTTLDDNTNGGLSFDRKASISQYVTNWFMSLRSNNQDLWFFSTYLDGDDIQQYWNPLKFNYSLEKTITLSGKVGINKEHPSYSLEVVGLTTLNGQTQINGGSSEGTIILNSTGTNGNRILFSDGNSGSSTGLYVKTGSSGYLEYAGARLFNDGSVGIGTTTPGSTSYKLMVGGTIRAKEIIVNTGWSDFVFEKNYKLLSLSEVENFINENKHLPDVPSEKEVMENGVSLGEMQSKLLQKIEELTLYIIKQDKEIKNLKNEVSNFKK